MPITITDQEGVSQILKLLPEIKNYYGDQGDYSVAVNLIPNGETPIKLDVMKGLVVGENKSVKFVLTIYGSNAQIPKEVACEFEFFLTLPVYL